MDENKYIHVLDVEGNRITSIVDNMLAPIGESALLEQAKKQYPDATKYLYGDDTMLNEFIAGKIYKNGVFVDAPVVEYTPTKAEQIAYIKKYYDKRFATIDQALIRRQLTNSDITDLQAQYNQLKLEMLAKIKAVK